MEINTQEYVDRLAKELGILSSNNILLNLQVETLLAQHEKDFSLIEGLKIRVRDQEEALRALREIAHPMNTRKKKDPETPTE